MMLLWGYALQVILSMIETILQVEAQIFPFEQAEGSGSVRVQDRQSFSLLGQLLQKRREMAKKSKLLENHYLIKLLNIYQENLTIHYVYEYVPYSLAKYLPRKIAKKMLCGRSIIKKISYDLTMMISFLASMRIELDLSLHNLGVTEDDKLKVFMSAKCRMGHKSQLSLIAHYGQCKEKIIAFLQTQLAVPEPPVQEAPNFVIKGNKLVFPKRDLNQSLYSNGVDQRFQSDSCNNSALDSGIFGSNIYSGVSNLSTASCINPNIHPQPSKMRQTQSPRFGRSLNFSQAKDPRGKSSKNHKNSFQFGAKKGRPDKYYTECDDDNSDAKSFTHSRSIRIQFQQKFDQNAKKKRKDSCKLKITTFHEYEMDDVDPKDIFGGNKEQFFQNFTKKAQEDEKVYFTKEPTQSTSDLFSKKQTMPEPMHTTSASSTRINLQEKVRLAREKAENLLSRFMTAKKPQNK